MKPTVKHAPKEAAPQAPTGAPTDATAKAIEAARKAEAAAQGGNPGLPPGAGDKAPDKPIGADTHPAPPDVQWKCELHLPKDQEELTVGTRFELECGGAAATIAKDSLSLEIPKSAKHALKLLEVKEFTDTHAVFVATTHMAGEIKLPNPVLTDGKTRLGLGEVHLKVATVVKAQEGEEPKPYPPWEAQTMGMPLYFWIFIAILCVVAAWAVVMAVRQSLARKRLLKELEAHGTALSPYNQFNKELRQLARKYPMSTGAKWSPELAIEYFKELNQSFRWFLSRELVVPAFDFKPSKTVKEVQKIDRGLHKTVAKDLLLALTEVDKALSAKGKVSAEDAQQVTDLCRRIADTISKTLTNVRQAP